MHRLSAFFFLLLFALIIVSCGGSDSTTPVVADTEVSATDDAYQTLSDTALSIDAPGVLSNDTGDGLSVSAYDKTSVEGGTVVMSMKGGFTYTPPVGYTGADSFAYTATDGANQATGAVLVTIEHIPVFSELQKRLASDGEADDIFGGSVSISGDYAIVGAKEEDSGGTDAGAAYLFHRDQGGIDNWGEVTKLTASDAGAYDWFGHSVSISGDYAIVGAYLEDSGGTNAGAVYLFHRNEGGADNWGEVTKLTASNAGLGDWFGGSVSISDEYVIVGAFHEDSGGSDAGAAYLFHRNQGGTDNWGEVTKLTGSDGEAGDSFGYSASISGDYAIVGAYGESSGGNYAGAAYLFHRNEGGANNWGEVTKLTASNAQASAFFGSSVTISGDYVIVGAFHEDSGGSDAGAAYLFHRNQGGTDNWGEVTKFIASNAGVGDSFGISVSIGGDYAIIGAYGKDAGGPDAGAAYLFHRNVGGADSWGEVTILTASDAGAEDYFGSSVSISGDYAIVGAYGEDSGGNYAGAVYLFKTE